jgi:hypothetical protein
VNVMRVSRRRRVEIKKAFASPLYRQADFSYTLTEAPREMFVDKFIAAKMRIKNQPYLKLRMANIQRRVDRGWKRNPVPYGFIRALSKPSLHRGTLMENEEDGAKVSQTKQRIGNQQFKSSSFACMLLRVEYLLHVFLVDFHHVVDAADFSRLRC